MKRISMERSGGEDSIWASCHGEAGKAVLVGSLKRDGKYGVMMRGVSASGELLWAKMHELECQCEVNAVIVVIREKKGYLMGGNACGTPTKEGGRDWKAYLLRTDGTGNPVMERFWEPGENSAVYSVKEHGEGFICAGETEKDGVSYVFMTKTDDLLRSVETIRFGPYENTLVGGLSESVLSYSFMRDGRWSGKVLEFDEDLKEKRALAELDGLQIYSSNIFDEGIFISGEREGKAYVGKVLLEGDNVEYLKGPGVITSIKSFDGCALLAGDLKGNPYVAILDRDMNIVEEHRETGISGWFEDVCSPDGRRLLAVGYSLKDRGALSVLLEKESL